MKKKTLFKGLLTVALGFALAACGNESATEKFEKAQKYGRAAAVSFYEDRKIDAENYKDITIIQKEESHSVNKVELDYVMNIDEELQHGTFDNITDSNTQIELYAGAKGDNKYIQVVVVKNTFTHTTVNTVGDANVLTVTTNQTLRNDTYHFFNEGDKFYLRKTVQTQNNADDPVVTDKYCEYDEAGYVSVIESLLKAANSEIKDAFFDVFDAETYIGYGDLLSHKYKGNDYQAKIGVSMFSIKRNKFDIVDTTTNSEINFKNKKPSVSKEEYISKSSTQESKFSTDVTVSYHAEISERGVESSTLDNSIKVTNMEHLFD